MKSRRQWTVLSVAAVMLLFAWRISPVPSPPLYDGVQLPNEPYRYLQPPAGQHSTKHPTSAHLATRLVPGASPALFLQTGEQSSQARLDLDAGALRVAQPTPLTLTIRPVLPPAQSPDGRFDGNVYRFAATSRGGTQLRLQSGTVQISLRGTGRIGSPIIEQYVAGHWERRATTYFQSTDYFVIHVSTLGDFALVFASGASAKPAEDKTILLLVFVFSVIASVGAMLIVLIRAVRRSRARASGSKKR